MFRIHLVSLVAISLFVTILGSPTPSPSGKDRRVLSLEEAQKRTFDLEPSFHTKRMVEFGPVLGAIKNQFREIIEDLLVQAFEYCKIHLKQFKVNLLRKLGQYTLSDVFHIIFDGVNDFVGIGSAPAPADDEYSDDKTVVVTPDFDGFSDAYSLAALLASKREAS